MKQRAAKTEVREQVVSVLEDAIRRVNEVDLDSMVPNNVREVETILALVEENLIILRDLADLLLKDHVTPTTKG